VSGDAAAGDVFDVVLGGLCGFNADVYHRERGFNTDVYHRDRGLNIESVGSVGSGGGSVYVYVCVCVGVCRC
jgi:hypothetical protein